MLFCADYQLKSRVDSPVPRNHSSGNKSEAKKEGKKKKEEGKKWKTLWTDRYPWKSLIPFLLVQPLVAYFSPPCRSCLEIRLAGLEHSYLLSRSRSRVMIEKLSCFKGFHLLVDEFFKAKER